MVLLLETIRNADLFTLSLNEKPVLQSIRLKHNFNADFYSQAIHVLCGLILLLLLSDHGLAMEYSELVTDEAQTLTSQYKDTIVQIRVIENKTNKKSSIGSGFYISQTGLIASNYHVIASVVQNPDSYHLEYVDYRGNSGEVSIVQVDVVHDLAIVKTDFKPNLHLALAEEEAKQGAKLFSFGNPHDLGLTVVEGTNNGLLEKTRNEKIHFSGSLNPGMSGGPTLNRLGEVVGINVSTAGNQISFLVPVKFLRNLYEKALLQPDIVTNQFDEQIEKQLLKDQRVFFTTLFDKEWPKESIGNVILPGELSPQFKCWGDSDKKEDRLIDSSLTQCSTEDDVFIDTGFSTGNMYYSYKHFVNRGLVQAHFYEIFQRKSGIQTTRNTSNEENVTNFKCHSDFVTIENKSWRTHTCARRYKKFPQIFDLVMNMALVSEKDQGLSISLLVSGIGQDMASQLTKRFLQELSWQN